MISLDLFSWLMLFVPPHASTSQSVLLVAERRVTMATNREDKEEVHSISSAANLCVERHGRGSKTQGVCYFLRHPHDPPRRSAWSRFKMSGFVLLFCARAKFSMQTPGEPPRASLRKCVARVSLRSYLPVSRSTQVSRG